VMAAGAVIGLDEQRNETFGGMEIKGFPDSPALDERVGPRTSLGSNPVLSTQFRKYVAL
jgi:hypothetical protein